MENPVMGENPRTEFCLLGAPLQLIMLWKSRFCSRATMSLSSNLALPPATMPPMSQGEILMLQYLVHRLKVVLFTVHAQPLNCQQICSDPNYSATEKSFVKYFDFFRAAVPALTVCYPSK